jgi:hypothetical protein
VTDTPIPSNAGKPNPGTAVTAGEFVDALVRLKRWSGMGYRQLAKRAAVIGQALPRSTLTVALNRNTLPREDLVVALALTCGCDEEEVARWVSARRRIAAGGSDRSGSATRWLGHRRVPVPGGRGRRDAGDEDDKDDEDDVHDYAETLELVYLELAERHARQAASSASIETRSVLLAGFVAIAAQFIATRDTQPVLQASALTAYTVSFIGGVAVLAVSSPGEALTASAFVEDHARRPKAQVLAALAAARVAALQANAGRQRRKAQCWWVAVVALGAATVLSVLAILQT